ncbi:alpha/beta fold hydrolase [Palleronia sp.]|uniref:alpha/beta fold hydrolase n=1 Tax=Palleronia sp. TaxID=1940284 RepID=UPI0035C7EB0D
MTGILIVLAILILLPVLTTGLLTAAGRLWVPPIGRFVTVDGARLHYRDVGDGPPIVLIHGAGAQMRTLTATLEPRLSDRFRLIAIDRPGMGYPNPQTDELTISRQAEILVAALDALDIRRPVLVGHSLGGALALILAQRAPERFAGLALVAPLTRHLEQMIEPFRSLVIPNERLRTALSYTIASPTALLRGPRTMRQAFAPEEPPTWFAIEGGGLLSARPRMFRAMSAEATLGTGDMIAIAAAYPSMTTRVAILYGREDAILNPATQGEQTAAEIPAATIDLVSGGHLLPITQPDLTADWIAKRANEMLAR